MFDCVKYVRALFTNHVTLGNICEEFLSQSQNKIDFKERHKMTVSQQLTIFIDELS